MAILLRDLYKETKSTYGLDLIAGEEGLDHLMNWVYISEDPGTLEFLHGGELIITTGVLCGNEYWLYNFIKGLIEHKTCGLIINIGGHLNRSDISDRIRMLCDWKHYPLFLMPWETRIFDITHDYYNRIFDDTQTSQAISTALSRVILHPNDKALMEISLPVLYEHGFQADAQYHLVYISDLRDTASMKPTAAQTNTSIQQSEHSTISSGYANTAGSFLQNLLTRLVRIYNLPYTFVNGTNYTLLICPARSNERLEQELSRLLYYMGESAGTAFLHIGISSPTKDLTGLSQAFLQGQCAVLMAQKKNSSLFFFDDMGFYKLLLSVNDTDVLREYVNDTLGSIITYDEQHHTNYLETLSQYLLCDGSIQKIAGALFCHRNTVNYRVRILREDLHLALDDPSTSFELMTAFQVRSYLDLFS